MRSFLVIVREVEEVTSKLGPITSCGFSIIVRTPIAIGLDSGPSSLVCNAHFQLWFGSSLIRVVHRQSPCGEK
jgi:hypothetical protein